MRLAEPPTYCSWKEVEESKTCISLQKFFPLDEAKPRYLHVARACPKCSLAANRLSWIYVATSEYSWKMHQGRAGWMTICEHCQCQVDFFVEIMN